MATYHFYLRESRRTDKPTALHLHIHWASKRIVFPTGCKVVPKHWSVDAERPIPRVPTCSKCSAPPSAHGHVTEVHRAISARLEELRAAAVGIMAAFAKDHNRSPEPEELRMALKSADGQPVGDMPTDVFGYFKDYNERRLGQVNRTTTKPLHPTLHGRNRKALEYLMEYVQSKNRGRLVPVHFSSLDRDFVNGFLTFLTQDKRLANNTVGKYMRAFREFLNDADQNGKGIEVPRAVLQRGAVAIPEEETTQIYLDRIELEAMYDLDLTASPRLERARDLFIVGAWTGLRFGDLSRVRPEHMEGDKIRVPTAKTGKVVPIPLHPHVKTIIAKYDGRVPSGISNQKQNEYIKEVATLVPALQVKVMKGKTKAGMHREVSVPKWKMVATHTARRSFATNLFRSGIQPRTIMAVTGHTTEKAFLRYIRLSADEHMEIIAQSPLFNPTNLRVA